MIEGAITGVNTVPDDAQGGAPQRRANWALVAEEQAGWLVIEGEKDAR